MPRSISEYRAQPAHEDRISGGRREAGTGPARAADLVSIVTITFNSERTIDRTIDSIAAQKHPAIEYIVVDGKSGDGTVARLRARSDAIDRWISEPDRGISDAFNKGIAMASGEYIALVNSDDWLEPTHLSTAVAKLRETGADFVFGDLMMHGGDGKPAHVSLGAPDYGATIRHAMPSMNHPTIVCKRSVYERHGLFDTACTTAMDYEWLRRGFEKGVRGCYVPGLMSHMTMEGVSHLDFARGLREVRDISIRYGYPPTLAYLRYIGRCAKTEARVFLEKWLPRRAIEWMRSRINAHHRSVDPGAG